MSAKKFSGRVKSISPLIITVIDGQEQEKFLPSRDYFKDLALEDEVQIVEDAVSKTRDVEVWRKGNLLTKVMIPIVGPV
jgi:hypothetical protein